MFPPVFYVPSHERKFLMASDIKDKRNYKLDNLDHILHKFIRTGFVFRGPDWLRGGRYEDRIPMGARFSAPVQNGPGAHPAPCTMGTGPFSGVKSGQGVTLTPHPFLVPWS